VTQPATQNPDALLSRELGTRQLAAGIFNYVVGSGIFALPAIAMGMLGPAAPLAYLACAILMGLVVLCFAEAGSRVSVSGGPYAYVEVALGPFIGFIAGALNYLIQVAASAAVTTFFAASVARLAGAEGSTVFRVALVVGTLAILAGVNIRGVRTGARVLEAVTVAKLVPLVGFVLIGVFFIDSSNLVWTNVPGFKATLGAAGILIFAFAGIEGALVPSGEVKDPNRTVPRAAFLALGLVTLLYIAIHLVAQGILGAELANDKVTPLATAAARFAGAAGFTIMVVAASISMLGHTSGAILATPRMLLAFGRDGFIPRWFASVHPTFRTPHVAIVFHTTVLIAVALSGTFVQLAILANVAVLTLYLLCAIAAGVLSRRDVRQSGEPFKAPGGLLVPVLAAIASGWLLWATVTRREFIALAGVVGVAVVMYGIRAARAGKIPSGV
jgi:APA family basic amino acid/polyamine antiporter